MRMGQLEKYWRKYLNTLKVSSFSEEIDTSNKNSPSPQNAC